jgi:small subunit ribosomal protein S6e
MTDVTCVISNGKTGRSYQKALDDTPFLGKKIGEKITGALVGLAGYELEITGGSDKAGFPMKQEIDGMGRKKMLLKKGDVGSRIRDKGLILRKTVVGNTIGAHTAQVNIKIITHGSKPVEELLGIQPKEAASEAQKPSS